MQLSGTVLRAIEHVLREAERKPADAVLREALRGPAFHPEQKRQVSQAVFTYYRWRGWLNSATSLRGQLEEAFALAERFSGKPDSFSNSDLLARALPAWALQVMEVTAPLVRELQSEPRLWLRARPGKAAELAGNLGTVEEHSLVPDAVWYQGSEDLFRTPEFHRGEFEIQDLSSQCVGRLCAPVPGSTWWDACAGEGGKTLHLCDLMNNKGIVWASDTAQWRLDILKRRASRAKLFNYRLKAWTSKDHLPTKTKFDGVLVDAPCTGLGTWGRNPHARWTSSISDVHALAKLQQEILAKVASSVKPGGKLVYSVCTLTRPETEEVADAFQAAHPNFEPLGLSLPGSDTAVSPRITLRPEAWHATGMFISSWKRVG